MKNIMLLTFVSLFLAVIYNDKFLFLNRDIASAKNNELEVELSRFVSEGLQYLERTQVKTEIKFKELKGEWPSYMTNRKSFLLLGKKGYEARDSNSFSTSTIHNLLAEMYLNNSQLDQIPLMLDSAIKNILTYRSEDTFNFWPLRPMSKDVKAKLKGREEFLVHGPTHFELPGKFINKAANVSDDSDDTSQAYRALYLNKLISEKTNGLIPGPTWENKKIGYIFSNFRDEKRHKSHFFNLLKKVPVNSGAFLTWLTKERKWFALRDVFPDIEGKYIPYGVNDVDCVVNTNILSALARYNELKTTKGVAKACAFVNRAIRKGHYDKCDVYYPNRYTLHYTASHARSLGVECLDESMDDIVVDLKETQLQNGSWTEKWSKDNTQSTAYALNALLETKDKSPMTHKMILKAIHFLLDNAISDENGIHWKGGIFFSGGTIIRKSVVWISDAVTTTYVIAALEKYRSRQLSSDQSFYMNENIDDEIDSDPYLGYFYRQKEYQRFDLQGDVSLAGSLKVFLKNGVDMLRKTDRSADIKAKADLEKKVQSIYSIDELNPIIEDREDWIWTKEKVNALEISSDAKQIMLTKAVGTDFSIDGTRSRPFKNKYMKEMYFQVIHDVFKERGITPKLGNIHKWHPDFKKRYPKAKAFVMKPFSKLMHALFKGVSAKFLVTGTEQELSEYILTRPYDSVSLDEAFKQSYIINNGDIYLTLLTIENIFSEHWDKPERENRALTRRLATIHHHFNKGDKYGAWYHLHGMILYGFVNGRIPAGIVGNAESFGDALFTGFKADKQENFINRHGGTIGKKLRKLVKKFNEKLSWPEDYFKADQKYLDPNYYLRPAPDYSKKIIRRLNKK